MCIKSSMRSYGSTNVFAQNLHNYLVKQPRKFCYRQRRSVSDATSVRKKLELLKRLNDDVYYKI